MGGGDRWGERESGYGGEFFGFIWLLKLVGGKKGWFDLFGGMRKCYV